MLFEQLAGLKILIVDDDPGVARLVSKMLAIEGFSQVETRQEWDPKDFQELSPDLLILDLRLPSKRHLDNLREARSICTELGGYRPILVFTGHENAETRRQVLDAGAQDFLTKPARVWEVQARVRNLLEARFYNVQAMREANLLGRLLDLEHRVPTASLDEL